MAVDFLWNVGPAQQYFIAPIQQTSQRLVGVVAYQKIVIVLLQQKNAVHGLTVAEALWYVEIELLEGVQLDIVAMLLDNALLLAHLAAQEEYADQMVADLITIVGLVQQVKHAMKLLDSAAFQIV